MEIIASFLILEFLGNHVLTILSNLFNNQNLTDAHTCYKVFKKIFFKTKLKENDFAFCAEVNTKISLLNEKNYRIANFL